MKWLLALILMASPATAHGMFTGTHDPQTGFGCCSGDTETTVLPKDCAFIPPEMAGVVSEVQGGYRVVLTIAQAKFFNAYASKPIDEVIPWNRVQGAGGFALCDHGDQIQCFFAPSNY